MDDITAEQAIVADETVWRTYITLKLQAIELNCRNTCLMSRDKNRSVEWVGRMLLQSIITGIFAVGMAILTLHLGK